MRRPTLLLLAMSVSAMACHPQRDEANAFSWSRELAPGGTLRIRDLNGAVSVVPAPDGKTARVTAAAHWRRGDPKRDLKFVALSEGNDATICVHWGTGTCTATQYTNHRAGGILSRIMKQGTDATVDLTVEVPAGTHVDVSTVNGEVAVTAQAPVHANTVNGSVYVATAIGPVAAATVNGSVDVRMTTLGGAGDVRAESTNGNVSAYVPQALDAKVTLRTTNGKVTNAFGLVAAGARKNRVEGVLGAGSRVVYLRTTNGSATLGALDALGKVVNTTAP
ncbi:MAG: DUF4097 family beta strand repeat-containing protein [Gemmatimonadaceae bacterium]